ncbi:hypothetical protein ECG_06965 [Echinococcus granulosus]|nr:hypothetical protein ECG_06965 [Echinococcus granulosus]CDS23081.1 hypothetical protein EgrG_002035000 [Echinococcus granulosus]
MGGQGTVDVFPSSWTRVSIGEEPLHSPLNDRLIKLKHPLKTSPKKANAFAASHEEREPGFYSGSVFEFPNHGDPRDVNNLAAKCSTSNLTNWEVPEGTKKAGLSVMLR